MEDMLKIYKLLCRKPSSTPASDDTRTVRVVFQIVVRYFKQINTVQFGRKIADLTVSGSQSVPRRCGFCKSQMLDDAFPRFKKLEHSRYVARFLKGGCGLDGCSPAGDCVWAIP